MLESLLNRLFFRQMRADRIGKKFLENIGSGVAEDFLGLLLKLMGLILRLDKDFRRNIEGFYGKYFFKSRDNQITVSAVFENGELKVSESGVDDPHVVVIFRNAQALMGYLLSPKPDILGSILRQDVKIEGNFNYLYKFAYMAKHLQLMFAGGV